MTIRNGEERYFFAVFVAWKNLADITDDQVREPGVVVFVWNQEHVFWKHSSIRAFVAMLENGGFHEHQVRSRTNQR